MQDISYLMANTCYISQEWRNMCFLVHIYWGNHGMLRYGKPFVLTVVFEETHHSPMECMIVIDVSRNMLFNKASWFVAGIFIEIICFWGISRTTQSCCIVIFLTSRLLAETSLMILSNHLQLIISLYSNLSLFRSRACGSYNKVQDWCIIVKSYILIHTLT